MGRTKPKSEEIARTLATTIEHFKSAEMTTDGGAGESYFNLTYPVLIEAAAELVKNPSRPERRLLHLMAHGLVGWNCQTSIWPLATRLIEAGESSSNSSGAWGSFLQAMADVRTLTTSSTATSVRKTHKSAFAKTRELLGVAASKKNGRSGVAGAATITKLMHFFAPEHCPILDSNVAKALATDTIRVTPRRRWYLELVTAQRAAGIVGKDVSGASAIRKLDIALWSAGATIKREKKNHARNAALSPQSQPPSTGG